MKIAVVSDSHNNRTYTARAAAIIAERGVDTVIHCGDVTGPDLLQEIFAGFILHVVLGNIDRDRAAIEAAVPALPAGSTADEVYETTADGVRIAAVHGHTRKLGELVEAGAYGFVFHGHTHRRRDEQVGTTRVVNPGALGGLKRETRSFCLVDPGAGRVEFIELAD
jgi:hypothetical protein